MLPFAMILSGLVLGDAKALVNEGADGARRLSERSRRFSAQMLDIADDMAMLRTDEMDLGMRQEALLRRMDMDGLYFENGQMYENADAFDRRVQSWRDILSSAYEMDPVPMVEIQKNPMIEYTIATTAKKGPWSTKDVQLIGLGAAAATIATVGVVAAATAAAPAVAVGTGAAAAAAATSSFVTASSTFAVAGTAGAAAGAGVGVTAAGVGVGAGVGAMMAGWLTWAHAGYYLDPAWQHTIQITNPKGEVEYNGVNLDAVKKVEFLNEMRRVTNDAFYTKLKSVMALAVQHPRAMEQTGKAKTWTIPHAQWQTIKLITGKKEDGASPSLKIGT